MDSNASVLLMPCLIVGSGDLAGGSGLDGAKAGAVHTECD